jgi:type IV pilus assembly protein PilA
MKKVQAGFTLIELMIVVAIIGILAAIAIPQYQTYIAKSQVTRVMGEIGNLKTATETCLNDGRNIIITTVPTVTQLTSCFLGGTKSNLLSGTNNTLPAGEGGPTAAPATIAATGNFTLVGTFAQNAQNSIAGSTVTWTRTPDGGWACTTNVDAKYAPAGCPKT